MADTMTLVLGGLAVVVVGYVLVVLVLSTVRDQSVDRTADQTTDRLEDLTGGFLSATRVLFVSVFSISLTIFGEAAQLAGDVGGMIGMMPMAAANVFAGVTGWLALSGTIPISPMQWALMIGAAFLGAVVIRNA